MVCLEIRSVNEQGSCLTSSHSRERGKQGAAKQSQLFSSCEATSGTGKTTKLSLPLKSSTDRALTAFDSMLARSARLDPCIESWRSPCAGICRRPRGSPVSLLIHRFSPVSMSETLCGVALDRASERGLPVVLRGCDCQTVRAAVRARGCG